MSPDVAKRELSLLFDDHDVNKDGFISKQELIDWILHSFRYSMLSIELFGCHIRLLCEKSKSQTSHEWHMFSAFFSFTGSWNKSKWPPGLVRWGGEGFTMGQYPITAGLLSIARWKTNRCKFPFVEMGQAPTGPHRILVVGTNQVMLVCPWNRSLDTEEAKHKLKLEDANKDGYISWPEMLLSSYSYTPDEVEEFAEDKNRDIQAFVQVCDA